MKLDKNLVRSALFYTTFYSCVSVEPCKIPEGDIKHSFISLVFRNVSEEHKLDA